MVVVVSGVAGSGKTSIGTLLARRLGVEYADADDFHPEANRRKMAAGEPLTDADRGPWLAAIGEWIDGRLAARESGVVSCSCLKRRYRDALRLDRQSARLVFLEVGEETIRERLTLRHGHFFPKMLAASQFEELEEPASDEPIVVVDGSLSKDEVVTQIIAALG